MPRHAQRLGLSLVLTSCLAGLAVPGDWPQWRGPHRDGVSEETGLLATWTKDGPPLVWKAKGLGSGYSSVILAKGKIFTMGSQRGGTTMTALDLEGKPLWTTRIGGGSEPNCTPTY